MARVRRRPYVPYQEAFENFTNLRKELNELISKDEYEFLEKFEEIKLKARDEDTVAMDVLAYYYKSGVAGVLDENYNRYIAWETVAAARGNEFAIEKLQFLIGFGCDLIMTCDDYETIKYKNDIDDNNALYVLGKHICKILVKDFLKAFPVDLVELEDDYQPYEQKYFTTLRRYIEEAVPLTISYLKS